MNTHKLFYSYIYLYLFIGFLFLITMALFLFNTLNNQNIHNCIMPETVLNRISESSCNSKSIDTLHLALLDQTFHKNILQGILSPTINRKPYGHYFVKNLESHSLELQYPNGIRWENGSVTFVISYYQYLAKLSKTLKYSFYSCIAASLYLLGFCFIYRKIGAIHVISLKIR